jgi:hypothetical protein
VQTGGVGCEEEFNDGRILTLKVFGVWLARAGMRLKARRLLALALIYDGGSRLDAARLGNVTPQIMRDWVMRFNSNGLMGWSTALLPAPSHCRTMISGLPWQRPSNGGRRLISTVSSDGVCAIWPGGVDFTRVESSASDRCATSSMADRSQIG